MIPRASALLLGASSVVALLLLLFLGRELLVGALLGRAGAHARQLAELGGAILPPVDPPLGPRREAFSWLLDPEGDAGGQGLAPDPVPKAGVRPKAPPLGPIPAPMVVLGQRQVLELANRGAVPRGVSRPAAHDLPAGIEILQGEGLGVGWFPGDRLISVGEVPVTDRAAVVRRVLEGRARRESVITATLARRTAGGVVTYRVLVEQPYLEGAPGP